MPSAKRLPSSLPLRMVGLHAKLALAILVGIAVAIAAVFFLINSVLRLA